MVYLRTKETEQFCRLCKTIRFLCLPRVPINRCVIILLLCVAIQVEAQNNFRTDVGIPYVPVLSISPPPTSGGAIFINSVDNKLYWYTGNQWMTANTVTAVTAPDGTPVVNIQSPSGRNWMDRNLGATQVATSITDVSSYGYLFQWCRYEDGHQVRTSPIYAISAGVALSDNSASAWKGSFIKTTSNMAWLNGGLNSGTLWWNGTVAGANNPCPAGYHVPTRAEWQSEIDAGMNSYQEAYSRLKMPLAGSRGYNSGFTSSYYDSKGPIYIGQYWSSTSFSSTNYTDAIGLYMCNSTDVGPVKFNLDMGLRQGNGNSVRCIKDL